MFYDKMLLNLYIRRLKKRGLRVGSNFQIEKGAILDTVFPELIIIGDNVTIARDVYVLCHDGSTKKAVGFSRISYTHLEDGVFIGAKSIILPGVTIGKNSIIGCGSIVTHDVPSCEVWAGNPAKKICDLQEFVNKNNNLLDLWGEPLMLNKKKAYKLAKKIKQNIRDRLDSKEIGFIE